MGFKQCFTFAYKESLLPRPFLPVSVRAGWPPGPGHCERLRALIGAQLGDCFIFGVSRSLFQGFQERFRINPWMDHLCPLLLLLLCAFAYFPVAFIEPEKQIMLNMYVIRSKEFSYFLFENLYLSLSVYLPTCLPTYLPTYIYLCFAVASELPSVVMA